MRKNYQLSYITMLCIALLSAAAVQAQQRLDLSEVSIVVSSCDKYAQLWSPFFKALERNWPELNTKHKDTKIYLIANQKKYPNDRVETINIVNETSWSDNMLEALAKVKTKYVLLFLDDYWVDAKVDEQRLQQLLHLMVQKDIAYIQLYTDSMSSSFTDPIEGVEGVYAKGKYTKYRASLQLALWETKALQQILRTGESAWDFELAASIRSAGYPKEFLTLTTNAPISYINASHQSHITKEALTLAKNLDPNFKNSMPILRKRYNWRLSLKHAKHRATTLVALLQRNFN